MRTHDDLRVEYNGKVEYLPTWCLTWSDEKFEEAKNILLDDLKNPTTYPEYVEPEINESQIRKDLKSDGFTKDQIEKIINKLYRGHGMDSAIQSVLD